MKKLSLTILFALFRLLLIADIPGNRPSAATHATILLPTNNSKGWKWSYEGSGVRGSLLSNINVITIPGGVGRPKTVYLFAENLFTQEKTEPISLWGGNDYFLVIDSASENKIYYKSVNEGEFLRIKNPVKNDTSNTVKADTGSYNIENKADGLGPALILLPVIFVLLIVAILALIYFMYKRYKKK